MNRARTLLLCALVALPAVAVAQDAPPQADDEKVVRDAIEEAKRLQAEGKFREAGAVLEAARPAARATASRPLLDELFIERLANGLLVAERYAAGEDACHYTAEELAAHGLPADAPRVQIAARLLRTVTRSVSNLEHPMIRLRVGTDPRLALLHASPDFRVYRWTLWRDPRVTIWPDARLVTGEPDCDALFLKLGPHSPPPGGTELKVVESWLNAHGPRGRPAPVDLWLLFFRASFLNPVNQGGWPTRFALLRQPDVVADVIEELDRRRGDEPATGFGAACLVNLTIVVEDYARTRALIAALEADPGERFLYDLAVHNARDLARMRAEGRPSPGLRALLDELEVRAAGLTPDPAPDDGEGEVH